MGYHNTLRHIDATRVRLQTIVDIEVRKVATRFHFHHRKKKLDIEQTWLCQSGPSMRGRRGRRVLSFYYRLSVSP